VFKASVLVRWTATIGLTAGRAGICIFRDALHIRMIPTDPRSRTASGPTTIQRPPCEAPVRASLGLHRRVTGGISCVEMRRGRTPDARGTPRTDGEALKLERTSALWTKRGTIATIVFGVLASVIAILAYLGASHRESPVGIVVTTVPQAQVGGVPLYPVAGDPQPSAFLPAGQSLYVDCLQPVKPNYLLARISDGPYKNRWVDAFDVKTPGGEDVRDLTPALPSCGPSITLAPVLAP
jgi:hypothetical protein